MQKNRLDAGRLYLTSSRTKKVFLTAGFFVAVVGLWGLVRRWLGGSGDWYVSGEFVRHHLAVTPQLEVQNVPPSQDIGYSAAVLYLVTRWHFRELLLSLSFLHQNVPMKPWPILLMYSDDLDKESLRNEFMIRLYDFLGRDQTSRWFVDRLEWIRLQWELPDGISQDKEVVQPIFGDYWPGGLGYHQMCAFYASKIFDHPRLQEITYYMRLDTDSYIYKPLCYDPFDLVHTRNRSYAYNYRTTDPDWVTIGLWNLVDDYARAHPEVESKLIKNGWEWPAGRDRDEMGKHDFPTYYNNFEIVKLDRWRQRDIKQWIEEIMSDPERIYKYRWGDASIRYATVQMFLDLKSDVAFHCGMDYWHNGVSGQCTCSEQLSAP